MLILIAMNVSLYQAAAALNATVKWQDMIAENLSAAMIPGYKKSEISFSAIQSGFLTVDPNYGILTQGLMPQSKTVQNLMPGQIKYTGEKTNFAIDGSGFFEVQMPQGGFAYTRDGEFHLDSQGRLVNKSGWLVMTTNGPVQFDLKNVDAIAITPQGEISQGGEVKGKLRIVNFDNPNLLKVLNGSYFLADDPKIKSFQVANPVLKQGCVEESNASPLLEMGNLIVAMRFYEANQRLIQMQDERIGKTINELSGTA